MKHQAACALILVSDFYGPASLSYLGHPAALVRVVTLCGHGLSLEDAVLRLLCGTSNPAIQEEILARGLCALLEEEHADLAASIIAFPASPAVTLSGYLFGEGAERLGEQRFPSLDGLKKVLRSHLGGSTPLSAPPSCLFGSRERQRREQARKQQQLLDARQVLYLTRLPAADAHLLRELLSGRDVLSIAQSLDQSAAKLHRKAARLMRETRRSNRKRPPVA